METPAQLGFFLGNLSPGDRVTFMDFLQRNPLVELVLTPSSDIVRMNVRGTDSERETIRVAYLSLPSATKSQAELIQALNTPRAGLI
jgi:hypothetical protein